MEEVRERTRNAHPGKKTTYRPDDLVWVRNLIHRVFKWQPGVVKRVVSESSYDVEVAGRIRRVSSSHLQHRSPTAKTIEGDPTVRAEDILPAPSKSGSYAPPAPTLPPTPAPEIPETTPTPLSPPTPAPPPVAISELPGPGRTTDARGSPSTSSLVPLSPRGPPSPRGQPSRGEQQQSQGGPQPPISPAVVQSTPKRTRAGRTVIPPKHLSDYVT